MMGDMGNEHPQIDINNIKKELTIEEIQEKLKDIVTKLNFAYNTGNQELMNQLTMFKNVYTRAQQELLDEMFSAEDEDLTDRIRIE